MIQSKSNQHNRIAGRALDERPAVDGGRPPTLMQKVRGQTEDLVAAYPIVFLSAAVASGLLLGWWVKRK